MTDRYRLAIDTGGTFTDLIVNGDRIFKSSTTPDDPVRGILEVLTIAAVDLGLSRRELLGRTVQFVLGTTRATNAVINGETAKTALFVTAGHPDVLLWREGGRMGTFDLKTAFPEPYIPRKLTFEVPERIGSQGEIVRELDEAATTKLIAEATAAGTEAVAVCFLWSIVNPKHERRVGELLGLQMPGVPFTLSHELNPVIREYRRASSAAIDASLKPLMAPFLGSLNARLAEEGLPRDVLVVTSAGGVLPAEHVGATPIHSLASGPATAPVAGRRFAAADSAADTAIVTDAGGTSFDVSLVRRGMIPWTRETRIGGSYLGPMTGFPSVDVKSIGAGGGSIAWVDQGGLLHVGPLSAGAVPGPACYGKGGTRPTVTDACVVLGYLDPRFFLGGTMPLDANQARDAVVAHVAGPLGMTAQEAAAAILTVATEHMINAIEDIAISQGIDPRRAPIVVGGGSGGFYASAILLRLQAPQAIVPQGAAALSALGALVSDLTSDFAEVLPTSTARFPIDDVNAVLDRLDGRAKTFLETVSGEAEATEITFSVEAHYHQQMWELEVQLPGGRFEGPEDIDNFRQAFHRVHEEVLAVFDERSEVETVTWRARALARLPHVDLGRPWPSAAADARRDASRTMFFAGSGMVTGQVLRGGSLAPDCPVDGPAIIESPTTTIVVAPGTSARQIASGSVLITPAN